MLLTGIVLQRFVLVDFVAGMFDRDQSGTIDLNEFQGLWNYLNQWRAVFDQFDRDRSGNIDASELNSGTVGLFF